MSAWPDRPTLARYLAEAVARGDAATAANLRGALAMLDELMGGRRRGRGAGRCTGRLRAAYSAPAAYFVLTRPATRQSRLCGGFVSV